MLFLHYYETVFEQWISDHYRSNKLIVPDDLSIDRIADLFNIDLRYENCNSFSDNEDGVIFLDKRLASVSARIVFFHELCHVLRHTGDQRRMPELFKHAQEAEANAFVLYSAMPFYIISTLQLPPMQGDAVQFLSSTFNVPPIIAKQRLDQIQRRELQGKMMATFNSNLIDNSITTHTPTETTIHAYYDPSGEFDAPSQIIVCVDEGTLVWQEQITISPDGPFERIEEQHIESFVDCKPVNYQDLDYTQDGKISLRLNRLASRYYNSVFKFVIQRKDFEDVMKFYGAYF